MTAAEREELNHLRECYQRMPSEVPRLIELERMDAAEQATQERRKLIDLVRSSSALTWIHGEDRRSAYQFHEKAVALLKEIGAWKCS